MINDSEPSQIEHDMISARMHGSCCPFGKVLVPPAPLEELTDAVVRPLLAAAETIVVSRFEVSQSRQALSRVLLRHLCQMEL